MSIAVSFDYTYEMASGLLRTYQSLTRSTSLTPKTNPTFGVRQYAPLTDLGSMVEEIHRIKNLLPKEIHMFREETAMDILERKPNQNIYTIGENQTVLEAIKKMEEKNLGALLVVDDNSKLSGIISERDYLKKVVLKGFRSSDLAVKEIMAKDITTISPTLPVRECMNLMTNKRFRHLPVVDVHNQVKGVVSIGDLVKSIIEQQDHTIQFQNKYISGLYSYENKNT